MLAGLAFVTLVSANGRTPFSGADSSVQSIANERSSVFGNVVQEKDGISVRVTGILTDGLQTAAELRVSGLPAGVALIQRGRPVLIDDDGIEYEATQVGSDAADRLALTITFPGLPPGLRAVDLRVPGFQAVAVKEGTPTSLGAAADASIAGDWAFSLTWEQALSDDVETLISSEQRTFGPAAITVEQIIRSASAIEVHGRIVGLTRDEFMSVMIVPASLRNAAGNEVGQVFGTQDDDGESFSLRFPRIEGDDLQLSIPFNRAPSAPGSDERLETYYGDTASFDLQLTAGD